MMFLLTSIYFILFFYNFSIYGENITNIRKQIEGVSEDTLKSKNPKDGNIVSFLVDNAKQIFDDINDTISVTTEKSISSPNTKTISEIITNNNKKSLLTLEIKNSTPKTIGTTKANNISRDEAKSLMQLAKDPFTIHDNEQEEINIENSKYSNSSVYNDPIQNDAATEISKKSCVFCNNVDTEECNDPRNKLISSKICERDDDVCYSMHTPFGIIDRGCFSLTHNMTFYVCSCNLCNFLSLSELPYIFPNKNQWIDNVIDLSHTKELKRSVFKEMSCLNCESKAQKLGDMLDNANCMEGNVGSVPTQICEPDEICGIKSIRSSGYIWRGCIKFPLYNYFWTFCDTDLCNHDAAVSMYDLS